MKKLKFNKKLKKIFLIISFILVLLICMFFYNKFQQNDKTIILEYSTSSIFYNRFDYDNNTKIEIKGSTKNKINSYLKKIKKDNCDCIYNPIAELYIDDSYSIIIGEDGDNGYYGNVYDNKKSSNPTLVTISKKLYDIVNNIIEEQREKLEITDLTSYKFELDSNNKYTIVTDSKFKTIANDEEKYTSIYYQIDLDNNIVSKIEEDYYANLDGSPSFKKNVLYIKKINDSIAEEAKVTIDYCLDKLEEKSNNNDYFSIETLNKSRDISNLDTIAEITNLLNKIDNSFGQKQLLFSLESTLFKCPSPILKVYDDNTYEYYDKVAFGDEKSVPKTGTYDFDINILLKKIKSYENSDSIAYTLKDNNNTIYSIDHHNDFLEDFLQSISVDIHICV